MKKTIPLDFVTGGTGFVGLRLCESISTQGRRVRASLRPGLGHAAKTNALKSLDVETIPLDLTDLREVSAALENVDTLYHLAWKSNRMSQGFSGPVGTPPGAFNLDVMETLVAAARSAGVRRFVFASTVSVYGPEVDWGPLPRKEEHARDDLGHHQSAYFRSYAAVKVQAEAILKAASPPLEYVILRPSMIYGPRAQFAQQFIGAARNGSGAGHDPHPVQWIHVDDVVRAFVTAGQAVEGANRTFNIAGAKAVLNHTVAEEVRSLVSNGGVFSAESGLDWSPRVPRYDISEAENRLGFQATIDWREGLAEMVAAEAA